MFRSLASLPKRVLRRALNRYAPAELATALKYMRASGNAAFPERNLTVTDNVPSEVTLVLSPHPDDEVIGMGGTLHMHATNGSPVTVLYLTDGAGLGTSRDELVGRRRSEAEAVARDCGIEQIFWTKRDTRLTNDEQTVREMANVVANLRPSRIYLPSYFDRHYDHFSTNAILAEALRVLGSPEIAVLGYEVWDNVPFQNYIVDISEHIEGKRRLMRYYGTPLKATDFVNLFECRGAVHYMLYVDSRLEKAPGRYAEAFCRLDAQTYLSLFDSYVKALEEHRSPMLRHLQGFRPASPAVLAGRP